MGSRMGMGPAPVYVGYKKRGKKKKTEREREEGWEGSEKNSPSDEKQMRSCLGHVCSLALMRSDVSSGISYRRQTEQDGERGLSSAFFASFPPLCRDKLPPGLIQSRP